MKQNKMKTYDYKVILSVAFLLLVLGVAGVLWQKPWFAVGSVEVGNYYQSSTLPSAVDAAGLTNLCPQQFNIASSTTGVLGSVFVTGYGSGSLLILDATTSDNNLRVSAATTTLTMFHAPIMATSSWSGLDVEFKRGLLVYATGTVGTTTITYRCEN